MKISPFESYFMALYVRKGGDPSEALRGTRVVIGGPSRM
jgi:hypothetical protein